MSQSFVIVGPVATLCIGAFLTLIAGTCGVKARYLGVIAALSAIISASILICNRSTLALSHSVSAESLYIDPLSGFACLLIILGTLVFILVSDSHLDSEGVDYPGEFYSLSLFAASGACLLTASADALTMFVSLELLSLALYALCGSGVRYRVSSEAALKYFVLGSFSSAILLFGFALLYGVTGSLSLSAYGDALSGVDSSLALVALIFVCTGLLFKVSAAPFHYWTADVYQGAPTQVTAFMSSVVKAAAMITLMRVLWVGFGSMVAFWTEFLPGIAVLTMCVGNFLAFRQTSLKRLLAYSSIAHAGYMLVAVAAGGGNVDGLAAVLFYLVVYVAVSLGTFAIITVVDAHRINRPQENSEDRHDSVFRLQGLGYTHPTLALLMVFFLLTLAGLPPGVAGLLGKFQIFSAALRADYKWLVVAGVINSAISCYYYLRVIKVMYFRSDMREVPIAPVPMFTQFGLTICGVALFLLSICPGRMFDLCRWAAQP